jgi:hypothetical protein
MVYLRRGKWISDEKFVGSIFKVNIYYEARKRDQVEDVLRCMIQ